MSMGGRLACFGLAFALVVQLGALFATVGAPVAAAQTLEPYHNYHTLREDTEALVEQHADIAELRIIGQSTAGLDIFTVDVALDIQERGDEELSQLPTLYVDGGHHGNEILSIETAHFLLEDVLEAASEDPATLENKRLVVTPVVNPDGFVADKRENPNGVDLNRNYPFHWGLYGTSDTPFTGTYNGEAPGSEAETQANMALMEQLNLYAYLSGHTGTYDIVLPWRASEDGEIPDWPLYNTTLQAIQEQTGLSYRDPSGAGESIAWAYGNRTAMSLVIEVDVEQNMPLSTEEVRQRLDEVLAAYHLAWDELERIGGQLTIVDASDENVTVRNDGWGPAYNATFVLADGSALPTNASETNASAPSHELGEIGPGQTVTMDAVPGAQAIGYERVAVGGEDPELKLKTRLLPHEINATQEPVEEDDDWLSVPAVGPLAAIALASIAALQGRRPRR